MSINKEKLLKELPCTITGNCINNVCNNSDKESTSVSECIGKVIKNFPEEQEQPIDFDALLIQWRDFDQCSGCNDNCDPAICIIDFLKSKNLTAQIDMDQLRNEIYSEIVKTKFEIPVKRYWDIKPDVYETLQKFLGAGMISYLNLKVAKHDDIPNSLKQFYDLQEEPDYSKIPKGSIVECVTKTTGTIYDKIDRVTESQIWLNRYSNIAISSIILIRIVELAKE